jgi:acyl-coenzyme A thioesterase PaaI-like protein
VLSVEFKTNLLRPARGERFAARATVLKAGRTVTVTEARCFAIEGDRETLVASMTGTMMTVLGRPGIEQ